jgi:minor extracellular protease Epr
VAKKSVTVKITKIIGATKYEVRYVQYNKKNWKTKTVGAGKLSVKLMKLKSGTKYKIQVRAVNVQNGQTVKGKWSAVKTVRTKK